MLWLRDIPFSISAGVGFIALSGIAVLNGLDKVRKGDVLVRISSQEIADMRSDLLAAQKRMYFAELTYEREKQLWEEKISASKRLKWLTYDTLSNA